jgi:ATP phosphoribosyltransferase
MAHKIMKTTCYLRIAVPSPESRLHAGTMKLLTKCGYHPSECDRRLAFKSGGMVFVMLRGRDIPFAVGRGIVDIGITGIDMLKESGAKLHILTSLPYRVSSVVLAARDPGFITEDASFRSKRNKARPLCVVSEYPHLTKQYFHERKQRVTIIEVHGAAEAYAWFPSVDYIVTLCTTGRTLCENGLRVSDTIIDTWPCVISVHEENNLPLHARMLVKKLIKANKSFSVKSKKASVAVAETPVRIP